MSNLKPKFITLCDLASLSNQNKLSIIGIFDRVFARALPAQYTQFTLVAILSGTQDLQETISLQVIDPQNNTTLPEKSLQVKVGNNSQVNIITTFTNFPLTSTGEYTFVLKSATKKIGETKLQVTKLSDKSISQSN